MVDKPVFPVFGPAPNPADPATFDARAADTLGKLPELAKAANKYPAYIDAAVADVEQKVDAAVADVEQKVDDLITKSRTLMRNLQSWTGGQSYGYDSPRKYKNYWMRFAFSKPDLCRRAVFVARFAGDANQNRSYEMKLQFNAHVARGALH